MTLDHDTVVTIIRSAVTVGTFLLFVAICLWAFSARRRQDFADAARLPLEDEAVPAAVSEGRK